MSRIFSVSDIFGKLLCQQNVGNTLYFQFIDIFSYVCLEVAKKRELSENFKKNIDFIKIAPLNSQKQYILDPKCWKSVIRKNRIVTVILSHINLLFFQKDFQHFGQKTKKRTEKKIKKVFRGVEKYPKFNEELTQKQNGNIPKNIQD